MPIPRFIAIISTVLIVMLLGAWLLLMGIDTYSFGAIIVASLVSFFPTLLAYSITYRTLEKSTKQFMQMLMTGMLAKMFVGVICIVIVAVRFPEIRNEYVVAYMITYFMLTGFEVYGLMRKLRPISNKGMNTKNE